MADIVGLIASVLQLVEVVVKARSYIKDFRDAPNDQQRLFGEIQNLDRLLRELDKRVEKNKAVGLSSAVQEVERPLIELKMTMDRLTMKLDSGSISSRLTWPLWGKEDVQDGLNGIERFKSLINAWLALDIWDSAQGKRNIPNQAHQLLTRTMVTESDISQSVKNIGHDQSQYHNQTISALEEAAEVHRIDHNYIAKSVRDLTRNQERYHNSSERDKIIEWYSPLNFFRRQADILSTREPGTGGWLFDNDWIKEWKSGVGKTVWCRGMPGAGKTVLASIMVNDLRTNLESLDTGVAVIYLNHKESEAHSPSNLLAGVWRQLVFHKSLSSNMDQLYETHREQHTRPSLEESHSILRSTVAEHSKVFLVVDALDEYPEEQRDILLRRLSVLGTNVNLMLTSRPHIRIDHAVPSSDMRILEVRANEDDIRRYIDAQITKSSRLSRHIKNCVGLRGEIESGIIWRSDGMFLLAKLNIDSIMKKHTVKAVRDALKNMPGDLNSTYDEVMERINRQSEDDRNLALRTLSWISKAETVLHFSELIEALAIEPGTTDLDPDNLLELDIILSVCAGLVVMDEEDKLVRLIHYTAQDYLDRIQDRHFPNAHTEITGACITYLSFEKFAKPRNLEVEELFDENPLLEYALLFCLIHARGEPELRIKDNILLFLTRLSVDWGYLWELMHGLHTSLPRKRLGIAAYFDMLEVAKHLIDEDGFDISALRGATVNGHIRIVRLLMKSRGYQEYVALQKASQAISRFNLNNDATADNAHPGQYITALQAASLQGDEESVHLLLERGADVNTETQPYGTALQAASVMGHYPVVCILLAHGAEVNSQNGMYGTALRAASLAGHTDTVLLLIENGVQIDVQPGRHGSALAAALACGRTDVANLLIAHGAT
ncbi:hypothetical protein B0H19DRAFT_1273269 [Mycena capillaripes]|nr:hypothetical protein B0H19DRAFT_1273269 [Mycena capillaripes]